jgi:hypothetical protein
MAEKLESLLTEMAAAEPKVEPKPEDETEGYAWKITYSTYRA